MAPLSSVMTTLRTVHAPASIQGGKSVKGSLFLSSRKRSDANIVTNTITLGRDVVERAYHQMIHAASAFKAAKPVRDELRDALAMPNTCTPALPAELVTDLAGIAVGRTAHVFNGACPDQVEGELVRDDECPACQILMRLDAIMPDAMRSKVSPEQAPASNAMPDVVSYPKGDLRRMLSVLAAIDAIPHATLVKVVGRTGIDKKTVTNLIAQAGEQAGVKITKTGAVYTLVEWGPIFKGAGAKMALTGALLQ